MQYGGWNKVVQLETVELQEPAEEWMDWNSQVPSANRGQSIPAPPWMGWENSPLAPRHYNWLVRLGRGPYTQEGETPGSTALLIGCGGGTLLPIAWLSATGARG